MQISPEEAAKALQEIEASRAAMRRAILTHRGYLYLWIWGCAWVAMSLLNWAYDYRAGPADWLIVGGGVLASLGIGLFQGTRIRSRIDRRFAAVCTTLLVFGYLVWPVFFGVPGHGSLAALWGGFHSYKAAYGYFTVVWMQLYIIGGIWFDGMWDKPDANWHLEQTYALIHRLQPAALIGNNHHHTPYPGEDFQMFEQDLPGANTAGFNQTSISSLPLETCETINHSWGYTQDDKAFKSVPKLLHFLIRAAGANANLLLNVGPTAQGEIQPEFVERLEAMGDWPKTRGETIYGTRAGPIAPRSWGVSTASGQRIYLHILDWQEPYLILPTLTGIKGASDFATHRKLSLTSVRGGMLLEVPPPSSDTIDRIVVLER